MIHLPPGRIGFAGIYGPNESEGRLALWSTLSSELDPSYRWTIIRDFNMVENLSDQWGGVGACISGRERSGLVTADASFFPAVFI